MVGVARAWGRLGAAICAILALGAARSPARAGAWTQPEGQGQLIATLWGWSGVGAPWGGNPAVRQNRVELQTYAEYGLNDAWTLFGQAAIERYALSKPESSLYAGLDYSQLGLRARLWAAGPFVVSGQAALFLPGATNPASPAQAGNTGGAGEGRMLAGMSFLVGRYDAFADLEIGYRLRSAGPPNEWHGDATLGVKPAPGWIVMIQTFRVVSAATANPAFPAWRESVIQGSLVMPVGNRWSLQIGVFRTTVAVKTNTERGGLLALWRTF